MSTNPKLKFSENQTLTTPGCLRRVLQSNTSISIDHAVSVRPATLTKERPLSIHRDIEAELCFDRVKCKVVLRLKQKSRVQM